MMTRSFVSLAATVALFAVLCAACQHVKPPVQTPPPANTVALSPMKESIPGLASATPALLASKPHGAAVVEWARGAKDTPIPQTTYSLYRTFRKDGSREPYQQPLGKKRDLLGRAALAVWLDNDEKSLPRVCDLIWSTCEETTWVYPAHEKAPWYIDLGCAETGATMSHIYHLLGDRLPEEVRKRIEKEIKDRILDPYLQHANEYGWKSGANNWTGVCAGSVGQAFLLMERDPDRCGRAIAIVVEQLRRFIANAFAQDGSSLEGMGYWDYGLSEFVIFAEMLRERTDGKIDLLDDPKMKAIARFPMAVALDPNLFASFSDAHEEGSVPAFIGAKLAERTGCTELLGMVASSPGAKVHETVCNLLWWDGKRLDNPPMADVVLPESGLARLVDTTTGHTVAVAAKAGDNAEPHNHNDVGTFIVAVDGVVYLCDPGSGLYSKDYFGLKRYDNVFCNSYGHSVPRIGGMLQREGKAARGIMEKAGGKAVRIGFDHAYTGAGLGPCTRDIALRDGGVSLEDHFTFAADGREFEEAFMTWREVSVEGSTARIISDKGALELRAEQGVFQVERLDEACRQNHKPTTLSRITVTYPAGKELHARFHMTFLPK